MENNLNGTLLKVERLIKFRSANSIKNKFYSVLRAFLKELFQCHSELKSRHKLFPEISSKIILRFYEGRNGKLLLI